MGAGMMNVLYMPPYSSIVELYPYHVDDNLYPTLASIQGVATYPVHSVNGSIVWANNKVPFHHCRVLSLHGCFAGCVFTVLFLSLCSRQYYFEHDCDDMTGMEVLALSGYCRTHAIEHPFIIEPHDFEVALVNAVQHAGHRLRYRGYRPQRREGTATGWG